MDQLELGLKIDYNMTILRNKQGEPRVFIVKAASESIAKKVVAEYLGYVPEFFDGRGYGHHPLPRNGDEPPQFAEGYWLRIL